MAKVKVAVLGTGSLGQHHARIYAELHAAGAVELTGIYDAHAETARSIAAKHKLHVFASVTEAAAASISCMGVGAHINFLSGPKSQEILILLPMDI